MATPICAGSLLSTPAYYNDVSDAPRLAKRRTAPSSCSAVRRDRCATDPRRPSSSILPDLIFGRDRRSRRDVELIASRSSGQKTKMRHHCPRFSRGRFQVHLAFRGPQCRIISAFLHTCKILLWRDRNFVAGVAGFVSLQLVRKGELNTPSGREQRAIM